MQTPGYPCLSNITPPLRPSHCLHKNALERRTMWSSAKDKELESMSVHRLPDPGVLKRLDLFVGVLIADRNDDAVVLRA